MSKLFDENEEFDESLDFTEEFILDEKTDEEEFVLVKTLSHDKIFDNDYNTGNLDFEEYTNLPKVNSKFAEDNLQECYDSYEYNRLMSLEKHVNEYFENTEFSRIFLTKKKIPKQILPQLFVSIREQFNTNDFSGSEIFTSIADYFTINYEVLYENIPSIYRSELVRELDEKYHILKKRKTKNLF